MLTLALASLAQVAGASDLDAARARRAEVQQRLDEAAGALAEVEAQVAQLEANRDRLAGQLADLEARVATADARISGRIRDLYKHGSVDPIVALLSADDAALGLEGATLVQRAVAGDRVETEVAAAGRTQLAAVAEQLAGQEAELADAIARQRTIVDALQGDLREAQQLEARLEAEERRRQEAARQQAAAAARQRQVEQQAAVRAAGGYACPIGRPRSFTDTWGAPRSGGRRHKGVDMLSPYGTPIYAVTGGTVDLRGYGRSAGYWLMLRGVDGTTYYYMHLQSYTVGDGARVAAGQQIATNGDTGNARGTPHLHFEQHPGGGGAVNPYPLAKRTCG